MGQRAHVPILLTLCALLFFLGLDSLGLTDRDEGSNAEAAREMVQSGNWLTPTLNGEPRFAKPVLLYWLIAGSYHLLGVSEFAARLPSAVFGTALILLQYAFARRFLGPTTGLLAALMLLLNFEILAVGRMVLTDMVLIFFTTFSIFSFFVACWGDGRAKRWYWGFYVGMALAVLTKGPVGLVPLLAILPFVLLTGRGRAVLKECRPVAGIVLFLAIAGPWYGVMFGLHGGDYSQSVRGDTLTRFFSAIGGHGGTILFYVPVLFLGFFPWSGFLPAALYWALRRSRTPAGAGKPTPTHPSPPAHALMVLCAVWVLTVFLFFTLAATRLPHYIAPLFPAAALLTAACWDRLLSQQEDRGAKLAVWFTLALGSGLGLAFIGLDWAYDHFKPQILLEFPAAQSLSPGWVALGVGFLILIGMGMFGYAALERGPAVSFGLLAALMLAVVLIIITIALPRFHRSFIAPPQELAAIAGLNLQPDETLIVYGRPQPSLLFYAQRECTPVRRCIDFIKAGEDRRLAPLLNRPGQIIILTQERLRGQLPPPAASYPVVLTRHGYVLLAKQPMF